MIYTFYTANITTTAQNAKAYKKIRFHYFPSSPYSARLTLKNRRLADFTVPIAISPPLSPSTTSEK